MYVVRKFKGNYLPSWETLVNAAQIRKLELILKILEKTEPDILQGIWYHRKCRSTCAVKKRSTTYWKGKTSCRFRRD